MDRLWQQGIEAFRINRDHPENLRSFQSSAHVETPIIGFDAGSCGFSDEVKSVVEIKVLINPNPL